MKALKTAHSDMLIALELLYCKTGRKYKFWMRQLKSVPFEHARFTRFALKLKGLSEIEILDLSRIPLELVEKTNRPMIDQELRHRRANGLLK